MQEYGVYIGEVAIGLLLTLILKIVFSTSKEVHRICAEVRTINGRIITLEEWRKGSTKIHDEREEETKRRLRNLENETE